MELHQMRRLDRHHLRTLVLGLSFALLTFLATAAVVFADGGGGVFPH